MTRQTKPGTSTNPTLWQVLELVLVSILTLLFIGAIIGGFYWMISTIAHADKVHKSECAAIDWNNRSIDYILDNSHAESCKSLWDRRQILKQNHPLSEMSYAELTSAKTNRFFNGDEIDREIRIRKIKVMEKMINASPDLKDRIQKLEKEVKAGEMILEEIIEEENFK